MVEKIGTVRGEVLACDLDGLGTEMGTSVEEVFGYYNGGSATVRSGAALEFGEG